MKFCFAKKEFGFPNSQLGLGDRRFEIPNPTTLHPQPSTNFGKTKFVSPGFKSRWGDSRFEIPDPTILDPQPSTNFA
jgi:hypothetical protein